MKAVVATFNQEKALVGAFAVITNLRMELFEALVRVQQQLSSYNLTTSTLTPSLTPHIYHSDISGPRRRPAAAVRVINIITWSR